MKEANFDVNLLMPRSPGSHGEWESYYNLRWRVLRAPWNQVRGSERDDREADSFHLALWTLAEQAIAVGRLHLNSPDEAQVRFMAVDPAFARQGLGSRILRGLETQALALGASCVVLNARQEAKNFYTRHGYTPTGVLAVLFGEIPHEGMVKRLPYRASI